MTDETTPTPTPTPPAPPAPSVPPAPAPANPANPAADELAALKASLADTAATVLAGIPEHLRGLIPANLSPADQIAWFHTAKATGVFDAAPAVPPTDTAKPTITPVDPDPSALPPFARMAAGYNS